MTDAWLINEAQTWHQVELYVCKEQIKWFTIKILLLFFLQVMKNTKRTDTAWALVNYGNNVTFIHNIVYF